MRNTFPRNAPDLAPVAADVAAGLEAMVRARFSLEDTESIVVKQQATTLPGFPPFETVVDFWTRDELRHHFKIFKTAAEVREEDLPFAWQKNTLVVHEGYSCECC